MRQCWALASGSAEAGRLGRLRLTQGHVDEASAANRRPAQASLLLALTMAGQRRRLLWSVHMEGTLWRVRITTALCA